MNRVLEKEREEEEGRNKEIPPTSVPSYSLEEKEHPMKQTNETEEEITKKKQKIQKEKARRLLTVESCFILSSF
jgi:hypothetical protein